MSTSFRSTQLVELKQRVRDMAIDAARRKAEQVAARMHVELGELLRVEESGREGFWGGLSNENAFAPAATTDAPLQPGALPLRLSVLVRYGLRDGAASQDQ